MTIRKATKKDFKSLSEIYVVEGSKKPYSLKRSKSEALNKIIEYAKKDHLYLFEEDRKIKGFIVGSIIFNKTELYIRELWVKSKFKKKGVGKALMDFIEKKHAKGKVKSITLETSEKSGGASRFYEKLKYKIYDRTVLMRKRIK